MAGDARAVEDLMALATVVLEGGLCSGRLPGFVEGIQQETGREPTYPVRLITRRIAAWHAAGRTLSPEETAAVLLMEAVRLHRPGSAHQEEPGAATAP